MPGADELTETGLFESEDFDAYLPEKWNSNMFTLGRRKVKGKLEVIGDELTKVLEDAGLSLVMRLSDEFPSLWNKKLVSTQWLFFSRDDAAMGKLTDFVDRERTLADTLADPTPRYRQVFLGVSFDKDHLEVGLRLHHDAWVDRQNLLNLAKTPQGVTRLKEVLHALPEHYEVSLPGTETYEPPNVNDDVIESLTKSFEAEKQWFFIGARLQKDQVLILGDDVIETVKDVIRDLVPVYKCCAWSSENDAISLDTLVAQRAETIEARGKELDKEKAEREEARLKKEAQGLKLQAEIQDKIQETQAWRQREYAARRAAAARAAEATRQDDARAKAEAAAAKLFGSDKKEETKSPEKIEEQPSKPSFERKPTQAPQTKSTSDARQDTPKQAKGPTVDPKRAEAIEIGDLVEVKKGFLKRRRGVVQDIDEKGTFRVNFGALSSRLDRDEVMGLGPKPAYKPRSDFSKKGDQRRSKPADKRFRAKISGADGGSGSKKSRD